MKHSRSYYMKQIKPLGKICYYLKIGRFYANGDGVGFIFNYWNPLSYPIMILNIVISIFLYGVFDTIRDRSGLGFCINPYFQKHPHLLYWI